MTAASATPQQMRDRLLQAIDSQSNQIRNMVAVLEVISHLEKHPITKEALETEALPRGGTGPGTPGSANGGAHPCRADATPPNLSPAGRPAPELKSRNDFHNTYSPKAEKSSGRKRKAEPRDGPSPSPPAKVAKAAGYDRIRNSTPPLPNTNGVGGGGSPEPLPPEADTHPPHQDARGWAEPLENDKHSRIPINAVRPHPTSPSLQLQARPPSASSLLKAAVMQQHAKMEEAAAAAAAGGAGQYQPRSPRCASFSPRSARQSETMARPSATYAPKGTLPSPAPAQAPSPSPSSPPLTTSPNSDSLLLRPHGTPHTSPHLPQTPPPLQEGSPPRPSPECVDGTEGFGQGPSCDTGRPESDSGTASCPEGGKRRKKKYRPRDYTVNLGGHAEERTKPVRLKERRLTFDPVTGQIKPLTHKESSSSSSYPCQGEEPLVLAPPETPRTEPPPQTLPTHGSTTAAPPLPSPFQQTNWKELSRNEIIQFYLNLQSNVLTSSGAQTPGAHYFMTEYLKREEHHIKEARKTHVLVPDSPDTGMPGVSREVTPNDLRRVGEEHWPGVNGCYDTKGNWYDWTECISLDPHGDESKLNILPYVCLD
ncbi:hypothetical protein JZ751_014245 [Albula glossodonta]|uniref:Mediator complex subunit 26 n=1 Tax=Albula glossodonta TaxID=121402 RepID=A0A8T2NSX5_9TELE|nr:hypothetical protein JZ751_014245 [Albula glossodonta]